jgi:hypothetical protein
LLAEDAMREFADELERRATQYDEGDDELELLYQRMDRHDRERKSDLWAARVLNVLVIAGLLFVAYVCFITRHDLVREFLDTWRSL